MNAFIEPQHTVYKYGEPVPHWQIFAGLNFNSGTPAGDDGSLNGNFVTLFAGFKL